jgi:hypothetical protein
VICKCMYWTTFRVVVQLREACAMIAPLSLVSLGVGSRVTRGKNVLWVC